jgi:hypothetical protein
MRQGQKNNRMRGRGRKPSNPLTRSYDSNGPDVKIRGTANHIAEKYQSLARDASASGDIVMAENYYQHAEHYLRIIASAQAASRDQDQRSQPQPGLNGAGEQQASPKPARRPRHAPVDLATEEQPEIVEIADVAAVKPVGEPEEKTAKTSEDARPADETKAERDEAPAPKRRRRAPARPRRRAPAAAAQESATEAPAVALSDAPQPVIADE